MTRLRFWLVAVPLLALAALLAALAANGDSITVDEPSHLVAGLSVLAAGDYRMSPDHPPLGRALAALPLLPSADPWPPPGVPGWSDGDFLRFGPAWLAGLADSHRRVLPARWVAIALLLGLCLAIAVAAASLFGRAASLLALCLAALDPGLLGHGHLVTMDVPFALAALLVLLAAARFLRAPGVLRGVLAIGALSAASLIKFSWVLLLPPLLLMAFVAGRRGDVLADAEPPAPDRARGPLLVASALAVLLGVWVGIWAAYGWRFSPFRGEDAGSARMATVSDFGRPRPATHREAWETLLHDPATGELRNDLPTRLARFAHDRRLLPEAYVYGFAFARKKAMHRAGYLLGEVSMTGWRSYFPIAFAIKTPIATLLLFGAGLAAILSRRAAIRDPLLATGLFGFAALYAIAAIASHLDIGHRHLLPLYPAVFVVAAAAATWLGTRTGKAAVVIGLAWLAVASLRAHPHQLGYFNELVGGSANGHRYLVDSNLDWGQDLRRLADWSRRHPGQRIKLARFGDAPLPPDLRSEPLVSEDPAQTLALLDAGTYVVSATELVGVYQPLRRDEAWASPQLEERYRQLAERFRQPLPLGALGRSDPALAAAEREYDVLRRARLIQRLRHRPPDARVGASLFIYRLTGGDVESLVRP